MTLLKRIRYGLSDSIIKVAMLFGKSEVLVAYSKINNSTTAYKAT